MPNWQQFQRQVDEMVDLHFGEPVELHPWIRAHYTGSGSADPSRPVIKTVGVFVMPGAAAHGEGGTMGSGMATRIIENQVWVSITDDNLKIKIDQWREGDRVYLPDRDDWYEIATPTLSATGRPQLNLVRIQEAAP